MAKIGYNMTKMSFRVDNEGIGLNLSMNVLAAILIKRNNLSITYCTQKEIDEVLNSKIEVSDHKNGHYTVKLNSKAKKYKV